MANVNVASPAERVNRDNLKQVQGHIAFARRTPDEEAPECAGGSGYDIAFVDYDVPIRDARPIVDELSLDREGFILVPHPMPCGEERDPDVLKRNYLKEMVPFVKEYFNASWVTTTDLGGVNIRSIGGSSFGSSPATDGNQGEKGRNLVRNFGAGYAHCDFSPVAAPVVAARDNQLQGNEIRSYSRLLIIQTWRVLSPPPQDLPLTLCDSSTISDGDLLDVSQNKYGTTGRVWIPHFNNSQRWYYFPNMTQDEFIMFKGYDSDAHYRPNSAHSAFDNRRAYPNAIPRESIETRFCVYYE
ncbi:CmcJ/NvfI family oxidoreductase [Nocardia sp. NPDC059246]|uniref:CmcJ/NvfI family oxidoreductase n=1 Tax=unclassified Nocardia TaxID=2637762 RepID=UPI0036A29BF0